MNAALVVMTILGCNDSGTDCNYITTAQERWPTVAMCDAVSEETLPNYANQPYPVIIAVCQNPEPETASAVPDTMQQQAQAPVNAPEATSTPEINEEQNRTLAGRAIQRVRNVLPTTEGVKTIMTKPVRLVEDGYSWVARKFDRSE